MIKLPNELQLKQVNVSDYSGSLYSSFNIDQQKLIGSLRTTRALTTTSGMSGLPVSFKSNGALLSCLSGSNVYVSSSRKANATFSLDATVGTPTDLDGGSDMEVFKGSFYVAGNGKLYKKGGSWTSVSIGFNGPYSVCEYASTLYIAGVSGNIKKTTDGTTIVAGIDLSQGGTTALGIMWIRPASNRIWIGTYNVRDGKGYVIEWDGASANTTNSYRLEARGTLSCVIKDDIPWIVDTDGNLLVFSNGTFVVVDKFPIEDKALLGSSDLATEINKFVNKNGMSVVGGHVNILARNIFEDSTSSSSERFSSGVWEYTEATGLYHKISLSYTPVGTNTITDYGQNKVSLTGALADLKIADTSTSATGNLLIGATIYTDATVTSSCIFTNDTFEATTGTTGEYSTQKYAYIVTSKLITAPTVKFFLTENWDKVFLRYKKLLSSADKIIVKYRTEITTPTNVTITWTSTSSFTTTTNLVGLDGYEVEVLQGKGGGKTAHIQRVDVTGAIYTVTLDDTFTGASGTAKARLQKWTKSGEIQNQTSDLSSLAIPATSSWIQIKVCFQFTGKSEFYDMHITSSPNQLTV